jgi:Carboxypeptidase regulatory-like domain
MGEVAGRSDGDARRLDSRVVSRPIISEPSNGSTSGPRSCLRRSKQTTPAHIVLEGRRTPTCCQTGGRPVLLPEKVRTVVTDGSGQYRIEDLRPGIYTLTFTRPGLRPFVRDGVEISSAFTASVNAQLAPGPVAETITVTAGSSHDRCSQRCRGDDGAQRHREGASDRPQLQRARRAHTRGGHQNERYRDWSHDRGVSDPRGPGQRRTPDARRPHRRRSVGRQPGNQLRGGRGRRRGGHLRRRGWAGRNRNGWARREPRAKGRRQLDARVSLFQRNRREASVRQPDIGSEEPGGHGGEARSGRSTTSRGRSEGRSPAIVCGISSVGIAAKARWTARTSTTTSTPRTQRSGCMHPT